MFTVILFLHFLADFPLQSHKMASLKSKRPDALARHVFVYTAVLTAGFPILTWNMTLKDPITTLCVFSALTFVTHFLTDAITSRISGGLFELAMIDFRENGYTGEKFGARLHDFFVVIGFDQFVHALTLYWTLRLLGIPLD